MPARNSAYRWCSYHHGAYSKQSRCKYFYFLGKEHPFSIIQPPLTFLCHYFCLLCCSNTWLCYETCVKYTMPGMLNDDLFSHIFAPCRCVLFPLMLKMKKHVSYKKTLLLKTSPIHTQCTPVEAVRGVGRRAVAGMVGILLWHCTAYVSVKVTNQCFNGSYKPCPGLTHALPNVAKVNIQQNFQISFCKMLKNKFICVMWN